MTKDNQAAWRAEDGRVINKGDLLVDNTTGRSGVVWIDEKGAWWITMSDTGPIPYLGAHIRLFEWLVACGRRTGETFAVSIKGNLLNDQGYS